MTTITRPKVERVRSGELVEWFTSGRIRIPAFQRPFRWDHRDVIRLFDSMWRGYPVGNLLMWQRPAPAEHIRIASLAVDAPAVPDALTVVDGQQRIVSLVGALTANEDDIESRFRVFFDLRAQEFVFGGRVREVPDHWLPMAVAWDNRKLLVWQRERPSLTDADYALCDAVGTAVRDYEIPMYVVTGDDEQVLRVVFDRLNNFGHRLTRSEVFQALHSSGSGASGDLRTLATDLTTLGFGDLTMSVLMQGVMATREGKVDREFRREFTDDRDRAEAISAAGTALRRAIEFLRSDVGFPHVKLVPYVLFIPVLTRFVALFGDPGGRAAELLRRWLWRGSVVGVAPQGNTVGVRRGAAAVYGDPVESADRLLRLLPVGGESWRPDARRIRLNSAQGKINALGLLSTGPRLVAPYRDSDSGDYFGEPGDRVDVPLLINDGSSFIQPILTDAALDASLMGGFANRIVQPPQSREPIVAVLSRPDAHKDLLTGHCIDADCHRLLVEGRYEAFLRRRAEALTTVIAEHVQRNALFGFVDGPDLGDLFDDPSGAADVA